ncbi:MAG: DUF4405 domain-containing protein [Spirochaetes bacterium]|jgi:hypothetical protein|nr:DUF4405 domain-containing protein [Spirochaetota bacterium]
MKRNTINYGIDVGLTLSFLVIAVTGILRYRELLQFFARRGIYIDTGPITEVHRWAGLLLTALVLAHIILHWRWIVKTTRGLFRARRREVAGSPRS